MLYAAKEWWAHAGTPIVRASKSTAVKLPPTTLRFKLDIVLNSGKGSTRPRSRGLRSLVGKDIRLFGLLHPLLEILLPDVRPGAPVHVRHLVLDGLSGDHGGGVAVLGENGLHAFDE